MDHGPRHWSEQEIEPPDEAFIQRIRDEVTSTLALAQASARLPWRNLEQCMLTDMRIRSIARSWLPPEEAERLTAAFAVEMQRLYTIRDAEYEAEHGPLLD